VGDRSVGFELKFTSMIVAVNSWNEVI
jgi:hypothetical protein